MTFDPKAVQVTCDSTQGSLCASTMEKYVDTVTIFLQKLEPKVIDP